MTYRYRLPTGQRWWSTCGDEPPVVALTYGGSAFHRPGPKVQRTACGRLVAVYSSLDVTTLDYCRRCWGPGAFTLAVCGTCLDMGVVEVPELLPCPTCRPVEHAAERRLCGLPPQG